jgi:hypothetical protein
MQFFITYSLAMLAFWIVEISTIPFIVYSFEYFLGGQMFPIDIMPAGIQAVMKWLPFSYEFFAQSRFFSSDSAARNWRRHCSSRSAGSFSLGPWHARCGNAVSTITRRLGLRVQTNEF